VRPYRAFGRRLASSLGLLLFAALSPRTAALSGNRRLPDTVRRIPRPLVRCYPGHLAGMFRHYRRQNRLDVWRYVTRYISRFM